MEVGLGRQRAEGRGQRARACWITTTFAAVPLSLHTHPSFSLTESICCQHASKCAQPTLTCCVMQMALRQVHYHTGGGCTQGPTTHHFPPFQVTSATPLCCWEGIVGVRKSPPTLPQKSPLRKGGKKIAQKISPLPFFQNAKTPYYYYYYFFYLIALKKEINIIYNK